MALNTYRSRLHRERPPWLGREAPEPVDTAPNPQNALGPGAARRVRASRGSNAAGTNSVGLLLYSDQIVRINADPRYGRYLAVGSQIDDEHCTAWCGIG